MILKALFQFPPGFVQALGYQGVRRFVALYWEPCGDEACYDDGVSYACGMSDNWLYLPGPTRHRFSIMPSPRRISSRKPASRAAAKRFLAMLSLDG